MEFDLNDPEVKAEVERIKQEAEQKVRGEAEAEKAGLVGEIKTLRAKKGLDPETGKEIPQEVAPDVIEVKVREILEKDRKAESEANRSKALQRFYEENKEFHPDNDPAGLKYRLIEDELKNFKLDGLYSETDFLKVFNKAKSLTMNRDREDSEVIRTDASSPVGSGAPRSTSASKLTPQERKLIEQEGWTEERYLKLKTKPNMDSFLAKLLKDIA